MRVSHGSGLNVTALIERRALPLLLGLLCGLAAVVLGLLVGASPAEQALLAARWTARAALPLFLIAFTTRAMAQFWPGASTRALLRRRRQWGLGFAVAHFIHLGALGYYVTRAAPVAERLSGFQLFVENVGGVVVFVFITLMAATSNDAAVRHLGRWWRRLHVTGAYAIWGAFTLAYTGRFTDGDPDHFVTAFMFAPLMLAALALRIYARFGRKRATA